MQCYSSLMNPSTRLVIVGGVAGGAAAAARARRLSESASITLLERGPDVSFANCGMPYHLSGEIADRARLAVQTPGSLRDLLNIEVRTRTEAVRIDRARKVVVARSAESGGETEFPYDKLVLAPGAAPLRPPLPGIDDPRILTLRTLQDMDRIKARAGEVDSALVIGAGFIGLEMAEALVHLGKRVTVVELLPQVLPPLDPEMAAPIAAELAGRGVDLVLGDGIAGFEPRPEGVAAKLNSGRIVEAGMVILSIGVRPESALAKEAGITLTPRGAIVVNEFQQTSDPDIYAAGDAVETSEPVLGRRGVVPLGGPAGRQGRAAADHIFLNGSGKPYPGSLGTAIVRVFDVAAGITGWSEKRLAAEKVPYRATMVAAPQRATYFPGAVMVTLKVLWSPEDGRVLGAQAHGADGVDKRIDVLATAIRGRMTIDDLAHLELAYAPPYGSARDVVNIAGFAACNARDGLAHPAPAITDDPAVQVVDVRPAEMARLRPVPHAVPIPLEQIRGRLAELDRSRPVLTVCALGKMSYFAARILAQNGFDARSLAGGLQAGNSNHTSKTSTPLQTPTPTSKPMNTPHPSQPPVTLDACGLACPGPIMKVRDAVAALAPGRELVVTASDAGFAADLPAFCRAGGLEFLGTEKARGIVTGRLRKPLAPLAAPETGNGASPRNGATLVVFSCEMDRVLASLVIANGAAAMGGKVTLFFTFWGLNALRRENGPAAAGKTFMDRMFGWMMPRGLKALPLSRMHFAGAGAAMMKGRMASKNLPNLHGLMAGARAAGVRLVACSMSMEAMGIRAEELIEGVEIGGVAEFLESASGTAANLFI